MTEITFPSSETSFANFAIKSQRKIKLTSDELIMIKSTVFHT